MSQGPLQDGHLFLGLFVLTFCLTTPIISAGEDGCNGEIQTIYAISNPQYLFSPGYKESQPYPVNALCEWLIKSPSSSYQVEIEFVFVETEHDKDCIYGYVSIYDYMDSLNDSTHLDTLCGNVTSAPTYRSTAGSIFIEFESDENQVARGFLLMFYTVASPSTDVVDGCGANSCNKTQNLYGELLQVQCDLSAPGAYDTPFLCWREFQVENDNKILLNIEYVQIGNMSTCDDNRLIVYDEVGSQVYTTCNNTGGIVLLSTGTSTKVKLVLEHQLSPVILRWKVKPYNSPCIEAGSQLVATSETQILTSPDYPDTYPVSLHCEWEIKSANYEVEIQVINFALETGYTSCEDTLEIYDWKAYNSDFELLGRFCNTSALQTTFRSTDRSLRVVFKTGNVASEDKGAGFELQFYTVPNSEDTTEGLKDTTVAPTTTKMSTSTTTTKISTKTSTSTTTTEISTKTSTSTTTTEISTKTSTSTTTSPTTAPTTPEEKGDGSESESRSSSDDDMVPLAIGLSVAVVVVIVLVVLVIVFVLRRRERQQKSTTSNLTLSGNLNSHGDRKSGGGWVLTPVSDVPPPLPPHHPAPLNRNSQAHYSQAYEGKDNGGYDRLQREDGTNDPVYEPRIYEALQEDDYTPSGYQELEDVKPSHPAHQSHTLQSQAAEYDYLEPVAAASFSSTPRTQL